MGVATKIASALGMPPRLEEDGVTDRVQIVAPRSWIKRIEEWKKRQPGDVPTRSEAIRFLVDFAIDAGALMPPREDEK